MVHEVVLVAFVTSQAVIPTALDSKILYINAYGLDSLIWYSRKKLLCSCLYQQLGMGSTSSSDMVPRVLASTRSIVRMRTIELSATENA